MTTLHTTDLPIRSEILETQAKAAAHWASPGTWWTAEQRVAIVNEARTAWDAAPLPAWTPPSSVDGLLGVTNTMSLSIFERTRELGLMRAVGMTGPQLRSAVRYESGIVALVGTIGGLALGGFFGWLVQRMASATFPVFDIPWTTLAAVAIAGVLAGVLAGWRPAIRASQLDVLDAISH